MNSPVSYFPRALIPIFFFGVLAMVMLDGLDAGQTEASFQMACAAYVVLISPILLRRRRKPTPMDLHLITWTPPVLFFLADRLITVAPRLPRLDLNWGIVARLWD